MEVNVSAARSADAELLLTLFGPAAAVIAEQLAEDARRRNTGEFSAREKESLRKQADRVLREHSSKETKEPTRKQKRNLLDWIEDASEIDPEKDSESTAKWQTILNEILNTNDQTTLDALKSLNTFDVRLIHKLEMPCGIVEGGTPSKLLNLGILEQRSIFDQWWVGISASGGTLSFLLAVFLLFITLQTQEASSNSIQPFFIAQLDFISSKDMSFFVFALFISAFGFLLILGIRAIKNRQRFYFTDFGSSIKIRIDHYLRQ